MEKVPIGTGLVALPPDAPKAKAGGSRNREGQMARRRIVVGLDASAAARDALRWAVREAGPASVLTPAA
jgi:hypothetical protein